MFQAARAVVGLALACLATFATGCGHRNRLPTAAVSGIVTLDGAVVRDGTVIFLPSAGRPARGDIDHDGRFVLSTYGDRDGAIVGRHVVAVVACLGGATLEGEPETPREWTVPQRYATPETSGLVVDVPVGGTTTVLALERLPTDGT